MSNQDYAGRGFLLRFITIKGDTHKFEKMDASIHRAMEVRALSHLFASYEGNYKTQCFVPSEQNTLATSQFAEGSHMCFKSHSCLLSHTGTQSFLLEPMSYMTTNEFLYHCLLIPFHLCGAT